MEHGAAMAVSWQGHTSRSCPGVAHASYKRTDSQPCCLLAGTQVRGMVLRKCQVYVNKGHRRLPQLGAGVMLCARTLGQQQRAWPGYHPRHASSSAITQEGPTPTPAGRFQPDLGHQVTPAGRPLQQTSTRTCQAATRCWGSFRQWAAAQCRRHSHPDE